MPGGDWHKWVAIGLAVLLFGGCSSNILAEKRQEDGKAERLRMESMGGWTSWDHRFTDDHKELGVMLKGESTF